MYTTYALALIQGKANRLYKNWLSASLSEYSITQSDWTLLGILFDKRNDLKLQEIAQIMGVEPPFATALIDELEKNHLVQRLPSSKDKRAKCVQLSSKGMSLVEKIEKDLRNKMDMLFEGVKEKDMNTYLQVLHTVVKNANYE